MGQAIKATVTKPYFCVWKCVHCQKLNIELLSITGTAQTSYGIIGTKMEEAKRRSRDNAQVNAEANIRKVQQDVNEKRQFQLISGKGVCRACGQAQPWHYPHWPPLASCAGVALAVFLLSRVVTLSITVQFIAYIGGLMLAWRGCRAVQNRLAGRALEAAQDAACYPLAIKDGVPAGVAEDDPRVAALFQLVGEMKGA